MIYKILKDLNSQKCNKTYVKRIQNDKCHNFKSCSAVWSCKQINVRWRYNVHEVEWYKIKRSLQ